MNKKLPSEYYDITNGIFLSKKILHSFGRRNGLITQLLLDIWEKSIKENKLLNGFAFISNDELFEKTAYNIKSNAFKNFKNCKQMEFFNNRNIWSRRWSVFQNKS